MSAREKPDAEKAKITRRKYLKYVGAGVVVVAVAGVGYYVTLPPATPTVPTTTMVAPTNTSTEQVALRVLIASAPESLAHCDPKIISQFEQSHPNITVTVDTLPADTETSTAKRELIEHSNTYDIIEGTDLSIVTDARTKGYGYYLEDLGGHDPTYLAQLDDPIKVIVQDPISKRIGPEISFVSNSQCLFCRKDLFTDPAEQKAFKAKYGYDLTYPATWQNVLDAAEFFYRPPNLFGIWTTGAVGWALLYGEFWSYLQSNGGGVMKNGVVTVNAPEWAETLQFQKNLSKFAPEGWLGQDWFTGTKLLEQGLLAMQTQWYFPWPDFFDSTKVNPKVYKNIYAVPVPKSPIGKRVAGVGGREIMVSKYAKHPNEAAELMRFWESFAISKQVALTGQVFLPVRNDVVKDPDVVALLHTDELFQDPSWSEFTPALGVPPEFYPFTAALYDPLAQAYNKYMSGEWSDVQALSWLQSQVEAIVTTSTTSTT